ncbi:hypothetical protein QR680_015232 [Steinernema hermaphroditum]|uniref:Acyltransferase 3 domain-containing protein n=1 Tax=Steinernema hermaphroditum TaxID=289476 RepID=A0AA39H962_9BILA|nr:hypothetical protein QR680_015232 [Steinernema hermaphroditum]
MKREDLQGIRGYSIILVLLFHLFPFIFANGYIGVDIFFVLSGYLMTMIYKKKVPDYRGFLTFYRKRLLRLLPVYSLVIFLTLALGSFMLIRIDYEHFLEEALAALALATNIRNHNDGLGYFDRLTYYSFFLHTWSLAVEVQYYLIVPFIFYALQRWPRGATLGTTILTGLSFILGLMAELYEIDAYDFLFARIWQFQVGALSAQFTNRKVKPSEKPLIDDSLDERPASQTFHPYVSRLLSLSLLVFMLPGVYFLSKSLVRTSSTLIAGLLFACSNNPDRPFFFYNRFFTFFGDISYVLYMVHWPAIVFCRYYFAFVISPISIALLATVVSLISAMFLHHLFEKPLLGDVRKSVICTIIFYSLCACILAAPSVLKENTPRQRFIGNTSSYYWANYTSYDPHWSKQDMIENAIEKNEAIYEAGMFVLPSGCERTVADLSCRLRFGASNISVLAIGSSYNYMALPGLYEAMKESVGTLEVVSVLRWEPLLKTTTMHIPEHCAQCESVLEYARQQEKDILFIINRYMFNFTDPITIPLEEDPLMEKAIEELDRLSKTSKKIVLSGVIWRYETWETNPMLNLLRWIKQKRNLEGIATYSYEYYLVQQGNSLKRIDYLLSRCPKCTFFDMQAPFCDSEKKVCRTIDEESFLGYFSDPHHITVAGMEKIVPALRSFVDDLIASINKS